MDTNGRQENKSNTANTIKTNRVKFLVEKTDESLLSNKNDNKNVAKKSFDSHLTDEVIWEFGDSSKIEGKFKLILIK